MLASDKVIIIGIIGIVVIMSSFKSFKVAVMF